MDEEGDEDSGEAFLLWTQGVFANEESCAAAEPAVQEEPVVASDKGKDVVFSFGPHCRVLVPRQEDDSAHISARIWRGSLLIASYLSASPTILTGNRTFLELGCGRGLAGLLAKAVGGEGLECMLTDCDDRALLPLCSLATVAHFLWEDDIPANRGLGMRHWSDAYRAADRIASLGELLVFDVIVASDCLYFACQEEPLAHVLLRRLSRSATAVALVLVQRRGNDGGFQLKRFLALLKEGGMHVRQDEGPWPWACLLQDHVRCLPGQEELELAYTGFEIGDPVLLTVTWNAPA